MSDFYQRGPRLANPYLADPVLRSYLRRALPPPMHAAVEPALRRLGERAATDIRAAGEAATAAPPRHVPYDAWGRRVDRIEVSDAWHALARVAAEEGLVALGYERNDGARSRIDQLARVYLFSPSSATYSCPLAMSDGAARCLELYGDDALRRGAFRHLTSRDPREAWTSGQWMTERTGGSDVSATSTIARPAGDVNDELNGAPTLARSAAASGDTHGKTFRLFGTKWFTSATTSEMALTLARIEGAPAGSRGLSLFYLELRDADGALRDIRIHRLKDKLGTVALPTAELTMEGTPAQLLGGPGDGVRKIAPLLGVTRLYNACAAAAGMRRALMLAEDYARGRVAFGLPIARQSLHRETLAAMEVECAGAVHLVFRAVELLGKEECGEATADESALLRLLTPVVKLYTGKQAVAVASEALEAFGGAGYIEDTGIPQLLRDAQVLSIWEGTTNVLSLDVLRAVDHGPGLDALLADVRALVGVGAGAGGAMLDTAAARVREGAERIARHAEHAAGAGREWREAGARRFAISLARVYGGALLLDHGRWSLAHEDDRRAVVTAARWCAGELTPLLEEGAGQLADSALLTGDGDPAAEPG